MKCSECNKSSIDLKTRLNKVETKYEDWQTV